MIITLADGRPMDPGKLLFTTHDPYLYGAEMAWERWHDFKQGRSADVGREIGSLLLSAFTPEFRAEMLRGFNDNLDHRALIDSA